MNGTLLFCFQINHMTSELSVRMHVVQDACNKLKIYVIKNWTIQRTKDKFSTELTEHGWEKSVNQLIKEFINTEASNKIKT